MLLYLRLQGGNVSGVVLDLETSIDTNSAELCKLIRRLVFAQHQLDVRQIIFAGKRMPEAGQPNCDGKLSDHGLYKECSLQIIVGQAINALPVEIAAPVAQKSKSEAKAAKGGDSKKDDAKSNKAKPPKTEKKSTTAPPVSESKIENKDEDEDGPPPPPPMSLKFFRQPTDEAVKFGDIVVVDLIAARSLIKQVAKSARRRRNKKKKVPVSTNRKQIIAQVEEEEKNDTNVTNPYVLITYKNHLKRSKVLYDDENPNWNEKFIFLYETSAKSEEDKKEDGQVVSESLNDCITFSFYSRNDDEEEEPLGQLDLYVERVLQRDQIVKRSFKLHGVKSGEVLLQLQRAALTSDVMKSIVLDLTKSEASTTPDLFARKQVTLEQLLGKAPLRIEDGKGFSKSFVDSNPALKGLRDLVSKGKLPFDVSCFPFQLHKVTSSFRIQEPESRLLEFFQLKKRVQLQIFHLELCGS
jgi:hypothetical protein